ncbi:MAG: hypothetical protein GEU82_16350 [Luteitalea sp.]|nr:hypothetical protein [Luteitalea sp.]
MSRTIQSGQRSSFPRSGGRSRVAFRTATVPLVAPEMLREARRSQLDIRVSTIFEVGKARLQANFDLYNALNASSILELNSTFGDQWRWPNRILDPRMAQVSGSVSF